MGIRNAKPGDIVYCAYGYGAKAEVLERLDWKKKRPFRTIYYRLKILDGSELLPKGTMLDARAITLSRKRASRADPTKRFGGPAES